MSLVELKGVRDGDQGPVYRFTIKDGGAVRDTSSVAVEFKIEDQDGAVVSTRPGVLVSPKSGGQVDLYLRGKETDWDGAGKVLILKPKLYYATAPAGTPATNLLLNPSFDTDTTPADGTADSWAFDDTFTGTKSVASDGPAPGVVFGNYQQIDHNVLTDLGNYYQIVSIASVAGDKYSGGFWHRVHDATQAANDLHGFEVHTVPAQTTNPTVRLRVGTSDWYFMSHTITASAVTSSLRLNIRTVGTTGQNRFDDAFLFKGIWRVIHAAAMRLPVSPRSRVAKTGGNLLAGVGSFEQDSDSNGIPDGWARTGAAATISVDQDPANVYVGSKALKVVPTNGAQHQAVSTTKRGSFKSGETWRATVRYKNSGAVTGTPAAAAYCLVLQGDEFDEAAYSTTVTAFPTASTSAYTLFTADLALAANTSQLRVHLRFAEVSGASMWFDDMKLTRV